MFKRLIVITGIILITASCTQQNVRQEAKQAPEPVTKPDISTDNYDFRKTKWGMTRQEVIKTENRRMLINRSDVISYRESFLNKIYGLHYRFQNEKLVAACYFLNETLNTNDEYETEYIILKEMLIEKYGFPIKSGLRQLKNGKDTDVKGTQFRPVEMVKLGRAEYRTEWETPETHIFLTMQNIDSELFLLISYISKTNKHSSIEEMINKL